MTRRRAWTWGSGVLAILLLALGLWKGGELRAKARVGAAYGARMTCSCRYVEGRSMASCKGDTEPGMEIVTITDHPEEKAVSGSVTLLANRVARFKPGYGCLMQP